jgi:hypothetical protein
VAARLVVCPRSSTRTAHRYSSCHSCASSGMPGGLRVDACFGPGPLPETMASRRDDGRVDRPADYSASAGAAVG